MRKILIIALMVALVPFATGCRINGLWGNDDGGTIATTTTPTTNQALFIPVDLEDSGLSTTGLTPLANILAATNATFTASTFQMKITIGFI